MANLKHLQIFIFSLLLKPFKYISALVVLFNVFVTGVAVVIAHKAGSKRYESQQNNENKFV
jgi:hypothetical protein